MLPPIPYLDVAAYKRRSRAPTNVDLTESLNPGFIDHAIAEGSSRINSRLGKRYKVPLGQAPPALIATGTLPPAVSLSGRPTLGSLEMAIQLTTPGPLGTAVARWSGDGGLTWTTVTTAATVVLGTTGLTAAFPNANYSLDNDYRASTPVPSVALGWLARIVDVDVWDVRGANPQDPTIARYVELRTEALTEVKEAADSKEGLFELPTTDDVGDSAIDQGGPIYYSEASPYVNADLREIEGRAEDLAGTGTYGGA
jgi:hypothetical protein